MNLRARVDSEAVGSDPAALARALAEWVALLDRERVTCYVDVAISVEAKPNSRPPVTVLPDDSVKRRSSIRPTISTASRPMVDVMVALVLGDDEIQT